MGTLLRRIRIKLNKKKHRLFPCTAVSDRHKRYAKRMLRQERKMLGK